MSYEYKIAKTELWFNVYRINEDELDYLGANMKWIKDKTCAKLFYHKEDALSNLVVAKFKWRKETEETSETQSKSEEISEKKSWSEF